MAQAQAQEVREALKGMLSAVVDEGLLEGGARVEAYVENGEPIVVVKGRYSFIMLRCHSAKDGLYSATAGPLDEIEDDDSGAWVGAWAPIRFELGGGMKATPVDAIRALRKEAEESAASIAKHLEHLQSDAEDYEDIFEGVLDAVEDAEAALNEILEMLGVKVEVV